MRKPAQNADGGAGLVARVIAPFKGCRDGEVYPVTLRVGDKITGALAATGIEMGKAKLIGEPLETKPAKPAEVAGESPFSDGPEKRASSRRAGPAKRKTTSRKPKAKPES
jgi:hypothetical protein